jgi:DNA-binding MarR family transcriptional regulator
VRGNCHAATVPLTQLCGTTVHVAGDTTVPVASAPDDAELERLLRQLLRVVIPPSGDAAVRNGAPRDGTARKATAPQNPIRDRTAQDATIGDRRAGNGSAAAAGKSGGDGVPVAPSGETAALVPQLSGSEARALIELVTARGIAQGELAGLLGLEKSTVSRLAAGLERKGWVRRGRDEGNQRYVHLYLTAEGGVVATRVWDAWHSRQARILGALSPEERAGLAAGLRGLLRGLAAEGLLGDRA